MDVYNKVSMFLNFVILFYNLIHPRNFYKSNVVKLKRYFLNSLKQVNYDTNEFDIGIQSTWL